MRQPQPCTPHQLPICPRCSHKRTTAKSSVTLPGSTSPCRQQQTLMSTHPFLYKPYVIPSTTAATPVTSLQANCLLKTSSLQTNSNTTVAVHRSTSFRRQQGSDMPTDFFTPKPHEISSTAANTSVCSRTATHQLTLRKLRTLKIVKPAKKLAKPVFLEGLVRSFGFHGFFRCFYGSFTISCWASSTTY